MKYKNRVSAGKGGSRAGNVPPSAQPPFRNKRQEGEPGKEETTIHAHTQYR